jgi:hypothetical protein
MKNINEFGKKEWMTSIYLVFSFMSLGIDDAPLWVTVLILANFLFAAWLLRRNVIDEKEPKKSGQL